MRRARRCEGVGVGKSATVKILGCEINATPQSATRFTVRVHYVGFWIWRQPAETINPREQARADS